jgi:hypothetical protein
MTRNADIGLFTEPLTSNIERSDRFTPAIDTKHPLSIIAAHDEGAKRCQY